MALKRPQEMLSAFSMASMTDVVFLLLVFFMVTSAFVFPTALEIDLPQSSQQTPVKPSNRIFIDDGGNCFVSIADSEMVPVGQDSLALYISAAVPADSLGAIAIYADTEVPYGKVVEVLNIGAENSMKMVLATKPLSDKPGTGMQPAGQQPEPDVADDSNE